MYVLGLAQPTGNRGDLVPVLYVLAGTLWSFFIHANVRWRLGWLEWLISTPAFHHWHHTNDGRGNTALTRLWLPGWLGNCCSRYDVNEAPASRSRSFVSVPSMISATAQPVEGAAVVAAERLSAESVDNITPVLGPRSGVLALAQRIDRATTESSPVRGIFAPDRESVAHEPRKAAPPTPVTSTTSAPA